MRCVNILLLLICTIVSCKRDAVEGENTESMYVDCTFEMLNIEIDKLSNEEILLDSTFHLSRGQIKLIVAGSPVNREERDSSMPRFIARLSDEQILKTDCMPAKLLPLKVGDLAFYCLAKIERLSFALATGKQIVQNLIFLIK